MFIPMVDYFRVAVSGRESATSAGTVPRFGSTEGDRSREPYFAAFDSSLWGRRIYLLFVFVAGGAGLLLFFSVLAPFGFSRPSGLGLYMAFLLPVFLLSQGMIIGVVGSSSFQRWYLSRKEGGTVNPPDTGE